MAVLATVLLLLSTPASARSISLPIETTNNDMILVPVKISGQNYILLLDTGAQHSIIGEVGVAKVKGQDTNRGLVFEAKARAVTVQLSGSPVFKMHVLSANLDGFKQRFGNAQRVDGILGQDILRRFASVRVDYKAKRIELVLLGDN